MAQKFMTYEQQLYKLQNDKGLTIPNADSAKKTLEEIGYYSLISGYKKLFLHPASAKYQYGVTFEEIVAFYHFDEQLRSIFLKYILQAERHLKSMISYHFTEIAKCRNVCAHGERLYDFRTTDMIPDTLLHQKLGIPLKKELYQNGKKDLFAVVIALRYLISDAEFKTFRKNLSLLIT